MADADALLIRKLNVAALEGGIVMGGLGSEELMDYRLARGPRSGEPGVGGAVGPKTWWRTHCNIWRIFCTAIPW